MRMLVAAIQIQGTTHRRASQCAAPRKGALLYLFSPHPTMGQTLEIRSTLATARVAAPTVEAERNVGSSPVSEAVSEVRPPWGRFLRPGHRGRPRRVTDEPQCEKGQRHLQDCAAGRDLHSGDTPRIQHDESFAVSTPQHPGGLGQRGDDMVDRLSFATRIPILVGDIHAVTADEPDTKHNRFHVPHTRRAWPTAMHVLPVDLSHRHGQARRSPAAGPDFEKYVHVVLIGREPERAQMAELLQNARHGSAGCVVVRGDPGVGKSALLEDVVGPAGEALVLRTEGLEVEAPLAFAALHRLLRPLARLRDQLPGPQARALKVAFGEEDGPPVEPFLVAIATLSMLTAAAEEGLVVCLVDDAHWLDPASAEALLFSARRIEADRILMAFTAREDAGRPFRAEGLQEIVLRGLGSEESRALLEDRLGEAPGPDVVARLVAETGGNPLALLELPTGLTPATAPGLRSAPGAAAPHREGRAGLPRPVSIPSSAGSDMAARGGRRGHRRAAGGHTRRGGTRGHRRCSPGRPGVRPPDR